MFAGTTWGVAKNHRLFAGRRRFVAAFGVCFLSGKRRRTGTAVQDKLAAMYEAAALPIGRYPLSKKKASIAKRSWLQRGFTLMILPISCGHGEVTLPMTLAKPSWCTCTARALSNESCTAFGRPGASEDRHMSWQQWGARASTDPWPWWGQPCAQ